MGLLDDGRTIPVIPVWLRCVIVFSSAAGSDGDYDSGSGSDHDRDHNHSLYVTYNCTCTTLYARPSPDRTTKLALIGQAS